MLKLNYRCCIFVAIMILAGVSSVYSQQLSFNHLTVEQGLSQNSVLCIAQDHRGFMWFGTRYGLNRFDGNQVIVYKNNPADSSSLSSNYINVLLTDFRNTLWVGTSEGLDRFDAEKNIFKRIDLNGHSGKINISSLAADKERIWVGTPAGLFFMNNSSSGNFISARSLGKMESFQAKNIMRLFRDSKDNLWMAADRKLYKISYTGGNFAEQVFISSTGDTTTLSDSYIQSITEDKQGRIWIGTIKGLNSFDPATGKFTRYFYNSSGNGLINNNVRSLLFDQSGKLWIGTQEGISLMDPANGHFVSHTNDASNEKSLSQNSVHSIFEDAGGSVWIGTFFGGANVVHRITTPFTVWQHGHPGLSNNVVSSIVCNNNLIWIGTEGGGLNCYNRNSRQFIVYKNIPGNPRSLNSNLVKTVFLDKEKHLWVGTHGGGLALFDPAHAAFNHFLYDENRKQSEIVALLEDSESRFWVGSHSGLKAFRRNNTTLSSIGYEDILKELNNKNISALLEDRQKYIWIGALEGLYVLSPSRNLQRLSINGNSSPNINCIIEDARGNIFLGLYNEGLAMFQVKDSSFTIYTTSNGLPNNNVLGIQEDQHQQLWISTSNGLTRFDPAHRSFQTYTTSDGLAGNEFNYNAFYKAPNGEMFFGGIKGLTSFFPEKIERNTKPSPIVYTGLKIFNTPITVDSPQWILEKDIGFTQQLVFPARQNTFTIEFALLNFIRPGKNKYAYKLAGIHKEWTEIRTPSATFTNLPAGNYTLLVKGANNDGIWSKPATMQITVLPPFWKTGLAYLLYLLLAAAILFFVIRFFYLRALLKRDKELHEVKLNFFTNISHEIRTHLTLIMAPLEKIQKENGQNNVLLHHLNNARNNVNRLLKLVTELMDFRKAESRHLKLHIANQDLTAFLKSIYDSFEDLSQARNIRLSFTYDDTTGIYFDREQMEKVFYNLLTNAFKFTPDGGAIALHVDDKKDHVLIHVTDNGKGIPPEYLDKLFTNYFQVNDFNNQNTGYGIGLALSKIIVELHKGHLTVESNAATGKQEGFTRFTITLLKGTVHFDQPVQQQNNITSSPSQNLQEPVVPLTDVVIRDEQDKQYHILITEDNDEVRNLIKETLQAYQLTECIDGESGWQAASEQIPDLIISDVMMPGMDGFTLCHKLKTDERTSHIPVVLLTAKSSQSDHISGLHKGADVYLTKPFSAQVLELTVRNILAARERMRQKFSKEFVLGPKSQVINNADEQFLSKLINVIEEYMTDPAFGVELLSGKMAMSQSVLYKKLKAVTDMSVNDFAKTIRLKKAAQLLRQQQYSVFDVSLMVGFNDRKYFSREFRKQFGQSPSEYMDAATPE